MEQLLHETEAVGTVPHASLLSITLNIILAWLLAICIRGVHDTYTREVYS